MCQIKEEQIIILHLIGTKATNCKNHLKTCGTARPQIGHASTQRVVSFTKKRNFIGPLCHAHKNMGSEHYSTIFMIIPYVLHI